MRKRQEDSSKAALLLHFAQQPCQCDYLVLEPDQVISCWRKLSLHAVRAGSRSEHNLHAESSISVELVEDHPKTIRDQHEPSYLQPQDIDCTIVRVSLLRARRVVYIKLIPQTSQPKLECNKTM